MVTIKPLSRTSGLLTEQLDDELLVYDEHRQLACALNATAAFVWRSSNGERTVEELAALLREEIGELADEDLVVVTLDRLEEQGLIESGYSRRDPDAVRLSRRRFIRRAGVVGAATLALPVVQSIAAPAAAAAASTCHVCYYCICYDYCNCEGCFAGYCTYCSACSSGPTTTFKHAVPRPPS